ncbi:CDP-glucose 4,6-dehydratase [Reichenbachiella agarivorans]|uniref:CDP-glucose 4,6-dehydratase n=1 Tax=Reichenbachiella agarivorans TaxID=2979464 RepID=A0ABY6CSW8_9BACT|nr:CDP-glucose 4,6-dehydratase [Reichenbachiella agarivorans]UXP32939.1 CDP-glucose 4,6-dehydratase [Reichenbachiella agarivorans]
MKLLNTFKGKKIFLTGHTGFKGSWMLVLLHHLGAQVKGYALEAEQTSLYRQIDGDLMCDSVIADLRDADRLNTEIKQFSPDFVFHFAAQPLVIDSYNDPKYTFDVNIGGTVNVLEAFRKLDHPCSLLAITTDKVYKNKESSIPYQESDELGGHDPYSASKAAMEIVLQSYINSFGLNGQNQKTSVIGRAGNVIGGGDWATNRIVPDIARSLLKNETLVLRNPHAIRPWQHVLDALMGYLLAIAQSHISENYIYNFGPDTEEKINVEDLTKIAMKVTGRGNYTIDQNLTALKETGQLLLDSNRAKKELGWRPVWNGQEAISQAMNWYLRYEGGEEPLHICQTNISNYLESAKNQYV